MGVPNEIIVREEKQKDKEPFPILRDVVCSNIKCEQNSHIHGRLTDIPSLAPSRVLDTLSAISFGSSFGTSSLVVNIS